MKRSLLLISAVLLGLYIVGGCDKEIKGPPRANIPPIVEFVNIPVDGAQFSSDTTIYWYGTDVDGFIKYFRYAVVESTIVGNDPDGFISTAPSNSIPWIVVPVTLQSPGTKDKVKMSADVSDPVRKFVASYIFIQAVDNLDAGSRVVYRMYRKNNHFPITLVTANPIHDPYINAKSPGIGSISLEGVSIQFSATDPIDYPRNPPPFEYQWKMYGPFDSLQMDTINMLYVESVFVDNFGDFYYLGDFYKTVNRIDTTIDTTTIPWDTTFDTVFNFILVDTLKGGNPYGSWDMFFYIDSLPPRFQRVIGESYNPLTGQPWVNDENINVYDVFRYDTVSTAGDTTRLKYFVIWCQARDDSKVPDPVPDYKWTSVIEPKFEREVILLDLTEYGNTTAGNYNYALFPGRDGYPESTPPMIKTVYGDLINTWKPGSFDTDNILPDDTIYNLSGEGPYFVYYSTFRCTQDYYAIAALLKYPLGGMPVISLRDVLKHKIILLVKDNATRVINLESVEGESILKGIRNGMSCWAMMRRPFASGTDIFDGLPPNLLQSAPSEYRIAFGVDLISFTAWAEFVSYLQFGPPAFWGPYGQIRIEDFVGAYSLDPNMPDLNIDTLLLESRYYWHRPPSYGALRFPFRCATATGPMVVGAYPEVGYVAKQSFSDTALYLYKSKYGTNTPQLSYTCSTIRTGNVLKYEGTVVAIKRNTPFFRTAHFTFTLLPFEREAALGVFEPMMDWLAEQPFLGAGKLAPNAFSGSQQQLQELDNVLRDMQIKKKAGLLRNIVEE
ncbi:MAG: hypothetical protein AB1690_00900 [Candidatus Zixiibacteriota bacterium]